MFGGRGESGDWTEHPMWQMQSSDRSDAPQCECGEALLRNILEADIGGIVKVDAALLRAVFYSGDDLGSFTGEPEDPSPWVITGADVMGILASLGVVASNVEDGAYIKQARGFGDLVRGPMTWRRALAEWVC